MQDRFKFRYLFDKKLYEVVLIDFKFNNIYLKIDDKYPLRTKFDDRKLVQCTGLKDKNGKLIYEGDIVQTTFDDNSKIIFYVIWNNENALFNGKIIKKREISAFYINEDYLYYLLANGIDEKTEIIGNIFQDKELMNEA